MTCVAAPVYIYLVMKNLQAKRPDLCVIVLGMDESLQQHCDIHATKIRFNNDANDVNDGAGGLKTYTKVESTRMRGSVEFADSILDMFIIDDCPTDSFEDMVLEFSKDAKDAMEVRVAVLCEDLLAILDEIDASATEEVIPPKVILECKVYPCRVIAHTVCWQSPPFYLKRDD